MFASVCLAAKNEPKLVDTILKAQFSGDLDEIKKRKTIRALVVYGHTDFYFSEDATPVGLQVDLLNEYEKYLNKDVKKPAEKIRVQYIPTTFDRLIDDLNAGKGDLIAALLTLTLEREKLIDFITAKKTKVNEIVVSNKKINNLESLEDLSNKEIYVLKGSSYVKHLHALNKSLKKQKLSPLIIKEADAHLSSEDILQMVNAGIVSLTVVDDYKGKVWGDTLKDLKVHNHLVIKADNHVGWGVRKKIHYLKKA